MENLSFHEHKSRIRRKHEEYAEEVAEDRVLRNTSKRGPLDRPSRPSKPRYRPSDTRTHQEVTQRKAVARGGRVGPVEPGVRPNLLWLPSRCILAGSLFLFSQGRLQVFPCKEMAGTDLKGYIKGLPPLTQDIPPSSLPPSLEDVVLQCKGKALPRLVLRVGGG